jgi:hypothetical protein
VNPWQKGVHMLEGILHPKPAVRVAVPTGPLPITPEWQRRRIQAEQAERQRRLDALISDATIFRHEHPHDHH